MERTECCWPRDLSLGAAVLQGAGWWCSVHSSPPLPPAPISHGKGRQVDTAWVDRGRGESGSGPKTAAGSGGSRQGGVGGVALGLTWPQNSGGGVGPGPKRAAGGGGAGCLAQQQRRGGWAWPCGRGEQRGNRPGSEGGGADAPPTPPSFLTGS